MSQFQGKAMIGLGSDKTILVIYCLSTQHGSVTWRRKVHFSCNYELVVFPGMLLRYSKLDQGCVCYGGPSQNTPGEGIFADIAEPRIFVNNEKCNNFTKICPFLKSLKRICINCTRTQIFPNKTKTSNVQKTRTSGTFLVQKMGAKYIIK